jgi:anti-sigma regulatory factor (Ser/Thr protein kinase)
LRSEDVGIDVMSRSFSTIPEMPVPNPLHLPPEPGAVGVARAWVGDVLADWPPEGLETARLLVSELVTNAVLHARTPIAVVCRTQGPRARFDVHDQHHAGPTPKRYAADSPTGRGMRLVASLAEEWGVERDLTERGGKAVWFILSRSTRVALRSDAAQTGVAAGRDPGGPPEERRRGGAASVSGEPGFPAPRRARDREHARHRAAADDTVDVLVLDLPVDVYLEAEQHHDAVVRELTLIVQSANDARPLEESKQLLELADRVRAAFAPASDKLREQVEDARRRGDGTVDVRMAVPRHGWEALLGLADWLDEVDRYCAAGKLLTLESSPRLRRFRSWYAQQVADQMQGLPPTPWEPAT